MAKCRSIHGPVQVSRCCPDINNFQNSINKSKRLKNARNYVKHARELHLGIFDLDNPLKLLACELCYLLRRQPPDRYIINLSSDRPKILKPTQYRTIQNMEDRLLVPEEYVPLFVKAGYEEST
jgi:hypothetical protein